MRISDWSSDVCSSDLRCAGAFERFTAENRLDRRALVAEDKWCARCARPDAALADRSDRKRPLVYAGERSGTDLSGIRSEEHTSELQSLMRISYAVFCLKKKITSCIITKMFFHTL